ncbi:MAG: tetratricopeptide repeat protein [Verrucomicrobiota bacterium]
MKGISRLAWNLLGVTLVATGQLRAELATVHLKDGRSLTVELVSVDRGQVQWKMSAGATQVQSFLRSQIEYVDFPKTNEWEAAERAFESGRFDEAMTLYREVIAEPDSQFYPMPGNFVSLAQVRLLDCLRMKMDAAEIAKQAQVVREGRTDLPPSLQEAPAEVAAWVALSKQAWQGAIDQMNSLETETPETYLIRGKAYEGLGNVGEAIRQYSGAYVLNFGGAVPMTQEALQRSASLLASLNNQNREPELQAQLKIYKDLFGKGSLWEGATDNLSQLAAGELAVVKEIAEGLDKPEAPEQAGMEALEETPAIKVAALPPLEERDWMLVSELDRKVVVIREEGMAESQPSLAGGVTESESGFVFDGTGGTVTQTGADPGPKFFKIIMRFKPETSDGAVLEMKSKRGGMGLHLEGGQMVFRWAPSGKKTQVLEIGEVTPGEFVTFAIHCSKATGLNVYGMGPEGRINLPLGGSNQSLWLGKSLPIVLGDLHPNKPEQSGWPELTPFQGEISYVYFASGEDGSKVREMEIEAMGKRLTMNPPKSE